LQISNVRLKSPYFSIPACGRQEYPNSKFETPHPSPLPTGERDGVRGSLEIGTWNLFGFWNLGFGI